MHILVTGANGFIGKNLCSQLELQGGVEILRFTRENTDTDLRYFVLKADFIYHIAGINRPKNEEEFTSGNKELTEQIVDILRGAGKKTPLLLTSSIQAELDNPYGKSKQAAEKAVVDWGKESGSPTYIYRLPGVFGKWSKPNYNSVVATFCNNIANDLPIEISSPNHEIILVYIDDVIREFVQHLEGEPKPGKGFPVIPRTFTTTLGELAERIKALHDIRTSLVVPDLSDLFNKFLYATYTSYLDKANFAYTLNKNSDDRGWLAEFVKSQQFGQVFISKTKPGISRGDHWHKTKIEKFLVVEGNAEITFRNKIDAQDIITYQVSGEEAKVVDIPVGYVHAITNTGKQDLITIFWANEILDKEYPDTFYEKVNNGAHNG